MTSRSNAHKTVIDQLITTLQLTTPSVETMLTNGLWQQQAITVHVKRDDTLHPIISGNKWRKLKYSLVQALENNTQHIVSFGGGFSNHLHALAYCCWQLNIRFSAIIRGDYRANPSPMLQDMMEWNSHIHYVTKAEYQQRNQQQYLQQLQLRYNDALIIPEGGSNELALKGVAEIVDELDRPYDYIIAPIASGGTLAGLIQATHNSKTQIVGIGVLKGRGYLEELVQALLGQTYCHWEICHDFTFGGYAKQSPELRDFCQEFQRVTRIELEPVYSGKLFFALQHLIQQHYFSPGSTVLALHTGGLQGTRTTQRND